MESFIHHYQESAGHHQSLFIQDLSHLLARHHQQQQTLRERENKPAARRTRNQEMMLRLDRIYPKEAFKSHHQTRPIMESTGQAEKQSTNKDLV